MKILYQTRKKRFFLSMKSVKRHSPLSRLVNYSLAFLLLFSFKLSAQEGNAASGETLFKANCAACHKLDKKLIGPELLKITERRDSEWLKSWIKDNNALVASGDKLAKEVQDSNPAAMTPFPQLSDEDLDNIADEVADDDDDDDDDLD